MRECGASVENQRGGRGDTILENGSPQRLIANPATDCKPSFQQLVGTSCKTSTQCGIAPTTKPRHSTAPLGLPGRQITSALSTTTARLRDRIAFFVSLSDSMRMASPNPGNS